MRFVTLVILTCLTNTLFSQSKAENDARNHFPEKQITFHNLSLKEGLSQNSVISIAQDSIGYLWFATQDGLNKYDGASFKYYNKQFEDVTKLTYSKLGKVYIDIENTMWIITNSGNLEKYNPTEDRFKSISNIKNVSNIFQDSKRNIYMGTYGNGLFKIDYKTKDTTQLFNKVSKPEAINQFLQYKNDIIITASKDVFCYKKETNNLIKFKTSDNITNVNYSSLSQLEDNTLFIGTYGKGLYYSKPNHYSLSPFTTLGKYNLPNDLNIESTLVDKQNRLWIATYGKGVFVINFKKRTIENFITQSNNPYTLHYNDVLCLFEDFTGNILVGTDGAGLSYYDEHLLKFNVLTNNQLPTNINIDVARSIHVDPNHDMWIGTSGKGLTKINLNKKYHKTYTEENSNISSKRIMSLKRVDDELWIGHQGKGLDIMDNKGVITSYNKNSKVKLNANAIWCIYKDYKNHIWLGTGGQGLLLFNKQEGVTEKYIFQKYNPASLTSNNIRIITGDNNGTLWIGTDDNGLCSVNIETKKVERYKNVPNKIKSLYLDEKKNILWIGTNGDGLKQLNTKTLQLKTFSTENGLPNNVIYSIIPDNSSNLWLSSNRGVTKFPIDEPQSPIINYDNSDGLQAFEFNTGAYFKDSNDYIYFGGLDGINWFNPNQLTINSTKPRTIISKLEIFSKENSLIQNKEFTYNQNTVTFTFSSLHFSQPSRNLYKYKLVGHDNDWIESGNSNRAHYTNLPSNDYEFKVISSNYDGVWNENPATYKFTIKKPWYVNSMAKLIYSILLILIGYLVYKYLKWRWQMKLQLQLEHTETVRLKDLDEFKTKLYTNISHEFRTPLTLILGPTENQLSKPEISKKDKKELTLINQNAKRLLNLVDQLIDLARLETGHQKLNVECNNLGTLLEQIASSFQFQTEKKDIDFRIEITKIKDVWFDKDIVEKIVSNLLANAVKYTPDGGTIIFTANAQNNNAIISVLNNGSQLKPENIGKLFTRFYQVNTHADGVGIGLALVKELISLTNGTLLANTLNDDEIQFTITLPINKAAFNSKDFSENESEIAQKVSPISKSINAEKEEKKSDKPAVLIVEDNNDVRLYIESILESKYQVLKAINGRSGIKKALKNIPDLIVSDVMMPITDGIELCNTLKNNVLTSHIPIVLLTAKVGEENELKGLEVGADDFITKPFNSKVLVKRIDNLINLSKSLQKRYSQHQILKPKDIAISSIDENFLNDIEIVLEESLSNPDFNVKVFSKLMLMSRMQLHRKLIALTGLTTSNFIRSQRLKQSTILLQKTDATVSEIAYQVGFNTPSYFIKCFKEAYNCTPNDYLSEV